MKFTDEQKENFEYYLDFHLPHGSGIDAAWNYEWQRNRLIAKCSFHCMDDNGMYCGWADFTVAFHYAKPMKDFTLHFNGDTAQYLNRKKMLRECIEQDIYHSMAVYRLRDALVKDCVRAACQKWATQWHVEYTRVDKTFTYAARVFAESAEQAIERLKARPWWCPHYETGVAYTLPDAMEDIIIDLSPEELGEVA